MKRVLLSGGASPVASPGATCCQTSCVGEGHFGRDSSNRCHRRCRGRANGDGPYRVRAWCSLPSLGFRRSQPCSGEMHGLEASRLRVEPRMSAFGFQSVRYDFGEGGHDLLVGPFWEEKKDRERAIYFSTTTNTRHITAHPPTQTMAKL